MLFARLLGTPDDQSSHQEYSFALRALSFRRTGWLADGEAPPDWRKITALASLAGIALGLLLTVIFLAVQDDDPAGAPPAPTTTRAADPQSAAASLGTPDTLPAPAIGAPGTTSSTVLVDAERATTPSFPPVDGLSTEQIDGFNLAVALGSAGNDLPRTATTSLVVGRDVGVRGDGRADHERYLR